MSDKQIFDDTPEYQAMKEAYRRDVLATIDTFTQRIKDAGTLAELHDLPHELKMKLSNLSYSFFVVELPRRIMRWKREQGIEA